MKSALIIQEATQSIPSGPACLAFCGFAESITLSAKSLLKAAALLFVALINSFNGVWGLASHSLTLRWLKGHLGVSNSSGVLYFTAASLFHIFIRIN